MPDRTVNEIIDAAYRKNGVLNPTATQDGYALIEFQDMLSSWSVEGLVVPYYVTENFTLTAGQAVYTIGVTGDSPDLVSTTGRPVRITDAFFRVSNDDWPIEVNMTKSEYARIIQKDTEVRPYRLYYDPQYPIGKIKFDTECDVAYDFHLISEKALTDVTAITDTLNLPLAVNRALVYNLAIGLSVELINNIGNDVRKTAMDSKESLENYNATEKLSGKVVLDNAIVSRGTGYMDFDRGY